MLPSTRKEMETFIGRCTANGLQVGWLEQGKLACHPTADGNIFLEERDQMFEAGEGIETKLADFFADLAATGEHSHILIRGQGLHKLGPSLDHGTGTFKPTPYRLAYAMF